MKTDVVVADNGEHRVYFSHCTPEFRERVKRGEEALRLLRMLWNDGVIDHFPTSDGSTEYLVGKLLKKSGKL